jgi:LGFP repeat
MLETTETAVAAARIGRAGSPRQPRWLGMAVMLAGAVAAATGGARAATSCLDPSVVGGAIQARWLALGGAGGPLGCPLSSEQDVPAGDGRFNQFQHGQIVWSPHQKMVVAANETKTRDGIDGHWWITDQYSYDAFTVDRVWYADGPQDKSQDFSHGDANVSTTAGSATLSTGAGRFQLRIEGCDRHPLAASTCHQGWSNWLTLDIGYLDVSHRVDGSPLPVPDAAAAVLDAVADLDLVALAASCRGSFGDLDESFGTLAYARLTVASQLGGPGGTGSLPANACGAAGAQALIKEVDAAIAGAKVPGNVGSTISVFQGAGIGAIPGVILGALLGGPAGVLVGAGVDLSAGAACSRSGDYDMALTTLIPIAYERSSLLSGPTFHHLLFDLLNQTGGAAQVITQVSACGVSIAETENHILSTESSRYLTNQLIWKNYPTDLNPPGSAQYRRDQNRYDNEVNGLDGWMLDTLHGFLTDDFHEYNARPYARLSLRALQNLANYAQGTTPGNTRVRDGAALVLDYLAAKFAVSSSSLRRVVPFRRRSERATFPWLYGNQSDEETWYFLGQAGAVQELDDLAYGHADWGSPGSILWAASGTYRVPDPILDLILNPPAAGTLQAFRHEGLEIYAAQPEFLISGGGRWQASLARDKVLGLSTGDTDGQALETTLMPASEGLARPDLIHIDGDKDGSKRDNSCVARGFACGLNPVVPDYLLRRFPSALENLTTCQPNAPVTGPIAAEWQRRGGAVGDLGCPLAAAAATADGGGTQQIFARGQIVLSPAQRLVVSASYDKGANALDVAWQVTDTFSYDFFIVRWDIDGTNAGQQDVQHGDLNASRTSGVFSVPLGAFGSYRVVVEGCDSHFGGSSTCRQSWSSPVLLAYPSILSCARGNGPWTFVDGTPRCSGQGGSNGYYAAVYAAPCADSASCKGQTFGFFAAQPAGFRGRLTFDAYVAAILAANGKTAWTADGANTFHTQDGHAVTFTPDHANGQWGVLAVDGKPPLPPSVDSWHLATGDPITARGDRCVVVVNRNLNQALILDFTDPRHPQPARTVALTAVPPTCASQ